MRCDDRGGERMKIGTVEIPGSLVLAPMAGVTDLAFRQVCSEQGAALTVSEMVSAKALVYGDKKTKQLLERFDGERPFSAQIFGSDADFMAEGAKIALAESGADIIDINMGCPTGKIVRSGDGCALMRDIEKAEKIIYAVARAVDVPVTVKFRKGWDGGSVNASELARAAERAGAAAVAVHGRTRAQLYSGHADWDIIAEVKKSVSIPVIANGDVFSEKDALRIRERTGCEMIMIGRGALGDPWLFARCAAAIEGRDIPPRPPLNERCDTAVRQFEAACRQKGEKIGCLEARKHFAWYLAGVPYSAYWKGEIMKIETLEDVYRVSAGIKRELRDEAKRGDGS